MSRCYLIVDPGPRYNQRHRVADVLARWQEYGDQQPYF